ncbi:hypothetical protein IW262DRAFT_1003155 [Armillaria fumosa]|nr:hypothetical protein IW262DRAFT_1003155 [Armillaria fumosa]
MSFRTGLFRRFFPLCLAFLSVGGHLCLDVRNQTWTLGDGSCRGNSQKVFRYGATSLELSCLEGGPAALFLTRILSIHPHTNPARPTQREHLRHLRMPPLVILIVSALHY